MYCKCTATCHIIVTLGLKKISTVKLLSSLYIWQLATQYKGSLQKKNKKILKNIQQSCGGIFTQIEDKY